MTVIDDYLKDLPVSQREALERIRTIVREMIPDAEETISYAIPTMKYKGKNVIHFAAFKDHLSVFPTAKPIAELEEELRPFKVAKGTIQFTVEKQIPEQLIRKLVSVRLAEL